MSAELPAGMALAPAEVRPLPRWAALMLTREHAAPLALFRMAIGLCAFFSLATVIWHGDLAALWMPRDAGGYHAPDVTWLFRLLGGADPLRIRVVLGVTLSTSLMLAAGLGGRLSALVTLVGYQSITWLNPDACGSYDPLLTNALWLNVLAEGSATLSLDCRLRTGSFVSDARILAFPRWLALYQIVLVYFMTGVQKVSDTWVPGGELSALYYILQQPTWQRWDALWLAHVFPLTQVGTLFTWLFEVGSPLLLVAIALERRGRGRLGRLLRRVPFRRGWALWGGLLHTGIALTMAVGVFPYLAPAFYLALLAPAPAD